MSEASVVAAVKRLLRAVARSAGAAIKPRRWQPVPASGVIHRPGNYRLDRDVDATGRIGIEIRANDVVLDLAKHRVTAAPASFEAPTFAVYANGVRDLTIGNGVLVGGWHGLHLIELSSGAITEIVFEDSNQIGLVSVDSRNLHIADCHLKMTVKDMAQPAGERYTVGMNLTGAGITVEENVVVFSYDHIEQDDPPLETIGILIGGNSRDVRITSNRVAASQSLPASYGVWGGSKSVIEVAGNTIENVDYGVAITNSAIARVAENSFTCMPDPSRTGTRRVCTAAMFSRAADLQDRENRINGYSATITRYDPDTAGH